MPDGEPSAEEPQSLVLLHGFAGTSRTWDGVLAHLPRERYRPLALDLPAHGIFADAPRPISFAGCVEHVLSRAPERFALAGYSMGGRIALHVALTAPERVSQLALVAGGAGIEDPAERAARGDAERRLAEEIETGSIEDFAERWSAQPLFARDPPWVAALARADYLRNRPDAIAAALRGVGQGEMESLWERLPSLALPVAAIAGERDTKFQAIAQRMVSLLPDARLQTVAGGHRLPLESPREVAAALARGR